MKLAALARVLLCTCCLSACGGAAIQKKIVINDATTRSECRDKCADEHKTCRRKKLVLPGRSSNAEPRRLTPEQWEQVVRDGHKLARQCAKTYAACVHRCPQ